MKLPIPVNIITGALGVGKTTAVAHLLRSKPPEEKWALLVNEFGSLGIDAALLEAELEAQQQGQQQGQEQDKERGKEQPGGSSSVSTITSSVSSSASGSSSGYVVRELAGGCLCCTLSGPLGVAIAQLVRNAKPDRLIIEPSGLGHPAGLLDTLYGEHLRTALDVRAVVCLVDVRVAAAEAEGGAVLAASAGGGGGSATGVPNETFQDQVNVADVLVGHKADLASPQQLQTFRDWAAQLYPPKAQVLLASHGAVDPAVLDLPRAPVFRPLFNPQSHASRRRAAQQRQRQLQSQPQSQSQSQSQGQDPVASPASTSSSEPTASMGRLTLEPVRSGTTGAAGDASDDDGDNTGGETEAASQLLVQLAPRRPLRFPSHAQPVTQGGASQGEGPARPAGAGQQQEAAGQPPGQPQPQGQGQVSCGWLFSAEDVFERERLTQVLAAVWPAAARLKGIFRVGKSSYVVPYRQPDAGGGCGVELRPISYRRESRLEVIVDSPGPHVAVAAVGGQGPAGEVLPYRASGAEGPQIIDGAASAAAAVPGLGAAVAAADWDAVERALLACLKA